MVPGCAPATFVSELNTPSSSFLWLQLCNEGRVHAAVSTGANRRRRYVAGGISGKLLVVVRLLLLDQRRDLWIDLVMPGTDCARLKLTAPPFGDCALEHVALRRKRRPSVPCRVTSKWS